MKKTLSLLVSFAIALSLLIGSSAAVASDSGAKLTPVGTFPIVEGERPTYTCIVATGPFIEDLNTNTQSLWYEELTNVKVIYEQINEVDVATKMNAILAADDLPDFFLNARVPDMASRYGAEEGMFIALDDLIDDNMIYIQETMKLFPEGTLDMVRASDGKLYGLPTIQDCFHCINACRLWINTDWLAAVNMDMPTTTDEFYAALKAFKEGDPNGNGKTDEIPMAGYVVGGWHATPEKMLMNSFLYYDLSLARDDTDGARNHGWFINDNKDVDTALNKDAYREGLRYINKLFSEGLLYESSFTADQEQITSLVENPDACMVGVVASGWGGGFAKVPGERYSQYMALPVLKGPEGIQYACTFPSTPDPVFFITDKAENPEILLRWTDYFYSEEGTLLFRRGPEGVNWRWPEEGEVGINGLPAVWTQLIPWNDSEPQNEWWVRLGTFAETDALRLGQTMDPSTDIHSMDGLELFLYRETAEKYRPYAQFEKVVPPLIYGADVSDEMNILKTDYSKYVKQWATDFMTGTKSLDDDWDNYIAGFDTMKLPRILEIMNGSYAGQYK